MIDIAVVGGGIVGLACALRISRRMPDATVVVLEKEPAPALHQSGRNSGVIHSGIYYAPGSLKARLTIAGARSLVAYCARRGIPHAVRGKLIVATSPDELPLLARLRERGVRNGVAVESLSPERAREREPHVACLEALWVPATGVTDFALVAAAYAQDLGARGGELRLDTRVTGLREGAGRCVVATDEGEIEARFLVGCAGLHSDRLARLGGVEPGARIVPFRGEYHALRPERRDLVRGLIYPVPDPAFPFLGVHLTRGVRGDVHVGPNAVLALRREGYRRRDVSPADLREILAYAGLRRLARAHWRAGLGEVWRSVNRAALLRTVRRLVPEIEPDDLVPAAAGVRAQALRPDGQMVDDFLLVDAPRGLHVCNAPSPAATASLEIGRVVADRIAARAEDLGIPCPAHAPASDGD